ncbi:D-ribose-binding periplasmic protein precursor [Vibrio aerogenes CECT 7868]|uniref:Autoinducer 2-binding periplasmic protein LuxP n=1 Tax=Vibrio aerogenes CECT 7868 TaxID=1216006 RepID=A0A1M5VK83_9VIBR|nr:substrate-binding domain-containing protein [Vibrio aerogenes]SHH75625.1 D-ribose-binding periplasmic protein precursor [Vibrio aerogenes CECT 7868]
MKYVFLLITFLGSCLPATVLGAAPKTDNCIAMVISGSDSRQFWAKMINGARLAGKELGMNVYARGTVNDKDTSGQKFILDSLLDKHHCRGVLIAPSDQARNADVARLKAQQIPVIYVDRDTGGDRLLSVKTDNEAAGVLAAKKMSAALKGQGKVVLFRLEKGVVSTDAREAGFLKGAQSAGLKVISSGYLGTRVGDATAIAAKTLSELGPVDGIFTPNDTTTIAVLQAREAIDYKRDVVHIGFDQDTIITEALKKGKIEGYIAQLPFDIGYRAVYAMYDKFEGNPVTENIKVPVLYIDSNTSE